MSGSAAWDLQEFVRLEYQVSAAHPIHVRTKLHPDACGASFDMHYELELGVVLSGGMERLYRDHRRSVGPGEVWLCGAWEPHGWRVTAGPCEALVVSLFPPLLASTTFSELGPVDWLAPFVAAAAERPVAAAAARSTLLQLGRELGSSVTVPAPRRFLLQRMLVYQLLLELPPVATLVPAAPTLAHDSYARLDRALQLVFQERRHVNSSEAAKRCGLGQKAFDTLFSRAMGVSFAKFSLRYRLQGAATSLLDSHEPVKAIAHDWGFVDASHFQVCFQNAYGCSPARYRDEGKLRGALKTSPSDPR